MTSDKLVSLCTAFVLLGGMGTRLREAYSNGPKAMAPVAGSPFLSYLLRQLGAAGFSDLVFCLGYGHKRIEEWVKAEKNLNLRISFSVEDEPLGTAGAIRLAAQRFQVSRRFVVMNGDSILQLDFRAMFQAHTEHGRTGTVALARVPDTSRYGSVELDSTGRIVQFREKSALASAGYINGGIYLFEPSVLGLVPPHGHVSLERTVLPALCPLDLCGFRSNGYFLDIGVPQDYQRAQTEFRRLTWL